MNGIPAALLIVSTALTALGSLVSGKKKKALVVTGIGTAFAACAAAALQEVKKRKSGDSVEKPDLEISIDVDIQKDDEENAEAVTEAEAADEAEAK